LPRFENSCPKNKAEEKPLCLAENKDLFLLSPKDEQYSLPDVEDSGFRMLHFVLWSLLRNCQGNMSHAMLANPKSNLHGYNITYKQKRILGD
jgi:hypothetical protein